MTSRTYRSIANLRLPSMTATALVALIVTLRTVFHDARSAQVRASKARAANSPSRKGKDDESPAVPVAIPPGVVTCMKRLTAVCASLEREVQSASARPDRRTLRRIARRYGASWRALRAFVSAYFELEAAGGIDATALRAAHDAVFGGKRSQMFLRADDEEMWSQGRQKLALVESKGLAAQVVSLGGEGIVAHLRATHDAFGAALGLTDVKPATEPRNVRNTMALARAAVDEYLVKVAAMIDAEVPGSAELANVLVTPIFAACESRRAESKVTVAEEEGTEDTRSTPVAPAPVAAPVAAPVVAPVVPVEPLKPTGTG